MSTIEPMFQIGDTVQLRSGGPQLTVTFTDRYGACHFIYFNSVSGVFEKEETDQRCLRGGTSYPSTPAHASKMRHTSVASSTLS